MTDQFTHAWPMFETYQSQINTFHNYSSENNINLKPIELADAGFFLLWERSDRRHKNVTHAEAD